MPFLPAVLSASISNATYTVEEADLSIQVCVILEGLIDRDVFISIFTESGSATGNGIQWEVVPFSEGPLSEVPL